jgi:hypothetical protein
MIEMLCTNCFRRRSLLYFHSRYGTPGSQALRLYFPRPPFRMHACRPSTIYSLLTRSSIASPNGTWDERYRGVNLKINTPPISITRTPHGLDLLLLFAAASGGTCGLYHIVSVSPKQRRMFLTRAEYILLIPGQNAPDKRREGAETVSNT